MTITEQDLREALRPLAGDPVRDAAMVLEVLPHPRPPLPPLTWWLGGAGLLLGALLGLLGGLAFGDGATAPPVEAPETGPSTEAGEQSGDKPEDKTPDRPGPPMPPMPMDIYVMAFGPLTVDEPGIGRQDLEPGAWGLLMGSSIETSRESQAGVHVVSDDIRLRLDRETAVAVEEARRLRLVRGRLFVQTGEYGGEVVVRTPMGQVVVRDGAAQIAGWPGSLEVLGLAGVTVLTPVSGPRREIGPGQELVADRAGVQARELDFTGSATSWMTEMIRMQQDDSELRKRILDMVAAYEQGDWRDDAETEIRKLGAPCVPLLVHSVQTLGADDARYRFRTVRLLQAIADFRTAHHLLPLLAHDDPEVRVTIFETLWRITGADAGGSVEFWRDASPGDRQQGIARWREVLGR